MSDESFDPDEAAVGDLLLALLEYGRADAETGVAGTVSAACRAVFEPAGSSEPKAKQLSRVVGGRLLPAYLESLQDFDSKDVQGLIESIRPWLGTTNAAGSSMSEVRGRTDPQRTLAARASHAITALAWRRFRSESDPRRKVRCWLSDRERVGFPKFEGRMTRRWAECFDASDGDSRAIRCRLGSR